MNSEIYGDVTNLPWGFVFARNGELLPKHPTQLYEALSYLILGFVMVWLYKRRLPKLKQGTLFGIFLTFLFGARFVIEFIKEPQSDFEVDMLFNMGQLLSLPFIVAGIAIWIWSVRKGKPAMLPPRKNQRVAR
jgi:prolipoprotein diacylglyceryltransferase